MSSQNLLFGWDMTFKLVEADIKSASDVIIALAHWFLVKNGDLRCLGVGDDKTFTPGEEGSELLPADWNYSQSAYTLRYVANGKIFLLLGTVSQAVKNMIVLNLMVTDTPNASTVTYYLDETVKQLRGPMSTMIPDIQEVLDRMNKDLLQPVISSAKKTIETQTVPEPPSDRRHPESDPHPMALPRRPHVDPDFEFDPLRNVGRGDLDPFGRGGGMLFNPPDLHGQLPNLGPFGPGGRRPLGVPPGARFDPFGPPGPNNRMGPDNDHFRPPGGYDDMFM